MNNNIKKIVLASILATVAATLKIVSEIISIGIPLVERVVSFQAIPLMVAGFLTGPWLGLASGFVADTIYALIPFSQGDFGSLFALTTMLWGLAGFIIKKSKIKPQLLNVALIITLASLLETTLNTLFIYIYFSQKTIASAYSLTRIIAMFVRIPITIHLTNKLLIRIPELHFDFDIDSEIVI